MMELAIAIAAIPIAGIVGWAFVARGRQRGDPGLERRIEDLAAAVYELRAEVDAVAGKQEEDRQLLEERLDVTERLLSRGRGG
jgi:hypothetical protein